MSPYNIELKRRFKLVPKTIPAVYTFGFRKKKFKSVAYKVHVHKCIILVSFCYVLESYSFEFKKWTRTTLNYMLEYTFLEQKNNQVFYIVSVYNEKPMKLDKLQKRIQSGFP